MQFTDIFSVLGGIVLVAGLAVLVRPGAQTGAVMTAASGGFVNSIQAATGVKAA